MKLLFISGDDYTALTFERMFAGTTVKEVIDDIERFTEEYEEKDGGYIELEVKDLNVDKEALVEIVNFVGDYDHLKSTNIYAECETFKP
jgi:hypothetical protein